MTIIDKYISEHYKTKQAYRIAADLGLSYQHVRDKITKVKRNDIANVKPTANRRQEIKALLNLIQIRVSGWAVEIAKERIRILEGISELY